MDFWNSASKHKQIIEPQTKRISTPAGQRLSIILENGDAGAAAKARDLHRASMRKSGLASALVGDVPRESIDGSNVDSYTYSVWSDGEKFAALKNNKQIAKRGGWKRVAIIAGLVLLMVIVLAVGLAFGLKKKGSSSSGDGSSATPTQPATPAATAIINPAITDLPTATVPTPSALPSNFPIGSYSFVTFLDTVLDNCTSLPSTWTCYPDIIYNTSPSKSMATFNWIISGSKGALKISSTTNPFSISFKNTDLELLDEGKDTERYRFSLQTLKTVSPSDDITGDNSAAECDYNDSTLSGYLYTKMKKGYPNEDDGDETGDPSFPVWPFAVKIEQTAAGGTGVPSCHTTADPKTIFSNIEPAETGALCSCFYKNWRPPIPT